MHGTYKHRAIARTRPNVFEQLPIMSVSTGSACQSTSHHACQYQHTSAIQHMKKFCWHGERACVSVHLYQPHALSFSLIAMWSYGRVVLLLGAAIPRIHAGTVHAPHACELGWGCMLHMASCLTVPRSLCISCWCDHVSVSFPSTLQISPTPRSPRPLHTSVSIVSVMSSIAHVQTATCRLQTQASSINKYNRMYNR